MRTPIVALMAVAVGLSIAGPVRAQPRERIADGRGHRVLPVVGRGWPIRRPLVPVIVRRPVVGFRVATRLFLPPVVWTEGALTPVPVAALPPVEVAWQDEQLLHPGDGWTEVALDCNARGQTLQIDLRDGAIEADWAEVVFGNGETQVVDFHGARLLPGLHTLLALDHVRYVDHVRMVAKAPRQPARVSVELLR